MATGNTLQKQDKQKFSVAITDMKIQKLINDTLGDAVRAKRFVASISSAVGANPTLQTCSARTIITAALLGESLNLSPSPQLGQYYMVPYNKKDRDGNIVEVQAQFQLGYKGYVQLAMRSGMYKKITVLPIKEGELIRFDPIDETIEVDLIEDDIERESTPTMGYYAMFEYINGFRKAMYWSYKKMLSHADKYSQAFNAKNYEKIQAGEIPQKDMWKYSSFWYKNFDDMGCKTMLRQLIGKWGVMSIEMQQAYESDNAVISEDKTPLPEEQEMDPIEVEHSEIDESDPLA